MGLVLGAPQLRSEEEKQTTPMNASTDEVAVIKTSEGEMVAEFWPDVAPKTVENFKKLAKAGFYDGTAFHRVIKGFMIQGGDPLTKDESKQSRWGTGDPGYKIDAEFSKKSHTKGVLSMARSQDPNSAGSQFFICHGDASFLDRKYTTEAEQAFQFAIEICPYSPEAVFRYVNLLMGQNRWEDAVPVVQSAVKADPEDAQFRDLLDRLRQLKKN